MKILILMPLDEKMVYAATGIYKKLPKEAQDKCFAMPMFMDYLRTTKQCDNWILAMYYSLISAKSIYNAARSAKDDVIIIGNMPQTFEFDAVFNFQDIEESLPYEDKFLNKVKTIVKEDAKLSKMIGNLYTNTDSKLAMHDCAATAEFLGKYIQSDPHLDELTEKYAAKIGSKKVLRYGSKKDRDNEA